MSTDVLDDRLDSIDKNADILFVNCPHFNVQFPNAGVAYLCEALRGKGYNPAYFDFNICLLNKYRDSGLTQYWEESSSNYLWRREEGFEQMKKIFGAEIEKVATALAAAPTPVIGFTVNMMNERCADAISSRIKEMAPKKKIIYGGFSYYHREVAREISSLPDAMIIGDGEKAIIRYMECLNSGESAYGIAGLIVNDDKGWRSYVQPDFTTPVDEIDWPRWTEHSMSDYTFLYPTLHIPIHPSRGCGWGHCTFCSAAPTNPVFRHRSAQHIFEEIKYVAETFGVKGIFLTTLQVNSDYGELGRLCDLLIEADLNVKLYGQFTIHRKMTYEFCRKLNRAGFNFITFGLESGCNAVLKMMRKGYNTRAASEVLSNCHRAGIITSVNLVVGYPGETEDHVLETYEFLRENKNVINQVEVTPMLNVQYGSKMWRDPASFGIRFEHGHNEWVVENWTSIDGSNNFDMRVDRQKRLLDFVKHLGIGRGYAEQKLDFSDGHPKEFDEELFTSLIHPQARKIMPEKVDNVLLLRSSMHSHVISFINILLKEKPDISIDMVLQNDCVETYSPLLGSGDLVVYDESAYFNINEIKPDKIEKLRGKQYHTVIFFYGQMAKGSYDGVREFALDICLHQAVGINLSGNIETFLKRDVAQPATSLID